MIDESRWVIDCVVFYVISIFVRLLLSINFHIKYCYQSLAIDRCLLYGYVMKQWVSAIRNVCFVWGVTITSCLLHLAIFVFLLVSLWLFFVKTVWLNDTVIARLSSTVLVNRLLNKYSSPYTIPCSERSKLIETSHTNLHGGFQWNIFLPKGRAVKSTLCLKRNWGRFFQLPVQ